MFTSQLLINKAFSCKNSLLSQTKSSEVGSMGYFLSQLQSPSLHRDTAATGRNRPQWTGAFPGGSEGKESTCNEGDLGSIPGLGRSPGGGHGNPLQYSCLESPHGQRSLAGYNTWGCRVGHDCATKHSAQQWAGLQQLPLWGSPLRMGYFTSRHTPVHPWPAWTWFLIALAPELSQDVSFSLIPQLSAAFS